MFAACCALQCAGIHIDGNCRYLVREVYNDGRRAPHVKMVQQPQIKRAHPGNKGLGHLEHFEATRSTSTLQALRASSKMTSDYADKRSQGVAPWDYKWRRASGASGLPLEQYNTARKVRTAQMRVAAPLHSRATAHDLPPMPGSFDSLVQEFQH